MRHLALGALLVLLAPAWSSADDRPQPLPRHAQVIGGAGTIRAPGYYVLDRDITVKGNGFVIAAPDVTIDLRGHTLTYGTGGETSYGVASRRRYTRGTTRITGGRIVQGGGTARACHAIDIAGGHHIEIDRVQIDVRGTDACGIYVYDKPAARVRIKGCTVACRTTTVTNRHYPGVAAIRLEDVPGAVEIRGNTVTASPQWGIQVSGKDATAPCNIADNVVRGTKALVANGYMLGIHRRQVKAWGNVLEGESRGIHVDGRDHDGHGAEIFGNRVIAQDQPNAEYPKHWCHGIKLESTRGTTVSHNYVRVVADATHSEARALDLDVENGGPLDVHHNRFEGLSRVKGKPGKAGKALVWYGVKRGETKSIRVRENVFIATDVLVWRTWDSDGGVIFERNAWLADPKAPAGRKPVFERWDNRDKVATTGHGFLDPYAPDGTITTSQWEEPGRYASVRRRTVRIRTLNGGKPAYSPSVAMAREVVSLVRVPQYWVDMPVEISTLRPGGEVDYHGPFQMKVGAAGAPDARIEPHLRGPADITVELTTGKITLDTTAPAAPTRLRTVPAGPYGPVVEWKPPGRESHLTYLVRVDGVPWQILRGKTAAALGGLPVGTKVKIDVRAIDMGGNVSEASKPIEMTVPKRP